MIATAAVHTAGINWLSVLTIIFGTVASIVAIITFLDKRMKDRQGEVRDAINAAVTNLSEILIERLETKDKVNQVIIQLTAVKEQVRFINEHYERTQNAVQSGTEKR